jgi:hypothetical protein
VAAVTAASSWASAREQGGCLPRIVFIWMAGHDDTGIVTTPFIGMMARRSSEEAGRSLHQRIVRNGMRGRDVRARLVPCDGARRRVGRAFEHVWDDAAVEPLPARAEQVPTGTGSVTVRNVCATSTVPSPAVLPPSTVPLR